MRKSLVTKLLLYGVIAAGIIAFFLTVAQLSVPSPVKFFCYCVLALVPAALKVKLPGITGTLTVSYVFVLIGLADMSLPECLIAGALAALVQCIVHATKRPRPIQVLFNVANVSLAIVACGAVFSWRYLHVSGIGLLMRLTFAAITYFLLNTLAVAAIIALTESKPLFRIWRECYLWTFPFFLVGAGFAWGFHYMAGAFGWQVALLALPGIYILYGAYHYYLSRLHNETLHAQNIAALHLRTIEALAMAIDAKDETTHDHLQRVHVYATEIARELNLTDLEMDAIQAAAMLHDIGKLAVPEHIISKPGKLTPEEFEKMKIHPVVGAEILEQVQFPYPVAEVVRGHHEKWDGSGYPDGLKGTEIPIGARILSVVDCLDAMASDRQYRKAVPLDEAMKMIVELSGTSYDPEIVAIMRRRYVELETLARKASPALVPGPAKNVVVERGEQPGAGFEKTRADLSQDDKLGFLTSIAAARQEVQTLFELSGDLGNSLCLSDTLSIFASKLKTMIPHDLICIYSIEQDMLRPCYVEGTEQHLYSSNRIGVGEGLSGWVAENNSPVVNGNPAVEPRDPHQGSVITNLKSALAIPLEEDGSAIGVITLYACGQDAFSRDHLRILQALGPRLGAALSNGRKLIEAQDNAVTDYLTGLPNSRSLYLHLDAEIARCRQRSGLGVFMCDLNGFKKINDDFGHLEGDRVLKAISAALRDNCRGSDYVARMGGDEFVVLSPDMEPGALDEYVRRLSDAVEKTGTGLGFTGLSTSVGSVILRPSEIDVSADTVLAEADRRMYANKRRKKDLSSRADLLSMAKIHQHGTEAFSPGNPDFQSGSASRPSVN